MVSLWCHVLPLHNPVQFRLSKIKPLYFIFTNQPKFFEILTRFLKNNSINYLIAAAATSLAIVLFVHRFIQSIYLFTFLNFKLLIKLFVRKDVQPRVTKPKLVVITEASVCIALSITSIIGNSRVCGATYRNSNLRSTTNLYIIA